MWKWGQARGHTDRIAVAELEPQTVRLVPVDGVVVKHFDIHLPFFEVIGRSYADAWREMLVDLGGESVRPVQILNDRPGLDRGVCVLLRAPASMSSLATDFTMSATARRSSEFTFDRRFDANILSRTAFYRGFLYVSVQ